MKTKRGKRVEHSDIETQPKVKRKLLIRFQEGAEHCVCSTINWPSFHKKQNLYSPQKYAVALKTNYEFLWSVPSRPKGKSKTP